MSGTVTVDRDTLDAVQAFMFREAELLDGGQFRDWLDLLDPDIRYVVPVRTTREGTEAAGWVSAIAHWDDDYTGLEMRVLRSETDFSWAESPRSRTRHFVSNIRTSPGSDADELVVRSNLLFFRSRGDSGRWELLSAERVDVLRRTDGSLRLARREVLLDHSTLPIDNLSVFL
ncbi:aromatic-ring-hydroxylating dioxygenase subunit beta [Mycobacterium sp. EPa45]|jgi:PAH dioxygenase small subunit|uniref:aromatic-ring-hydroxylating dioxygenase subunit beta n=1 Tax=Mycobacterium sp. EPa45 TaxID=1545728 RepID=UPI00064197D2|nr:aromatic-ring-hydroxylating dioxygenase subunit beta [Mycobacterium sp. EPa45]AKK30564.1 aromatic-ring-hydroxylating dioxygenase [Mycobacterium sp. EPa45]